MVTRHIHRIKNEKHTIATIDAKLQHPFTVETLSKLGQKEFPQPDEEQLQKLTAHVRLVAERPDAASSRKIRNRTWTPDFTGSVLMSCWNSSQGSKARECNEGHPDWRKDVTRSQFIGGTILCIENPRESTKIKLLKPYKQVQQVRRLRDPWTKLIIVHYTGNEQSKDELKNQFHV